MPGAVEAAGLLVARGVDLVVVGGTALWLHGDRTRPIKDLDVVPNPEVENLDRLVACRTAIVTPTRWWPSRRSLMEQPLVSLTTSFGPIDILSQRGREEFTQLRSAATLIAADGVATPVASIADVWRLKKRFKETPDEWS